MYRYDDAPLVPGARFARRAPLRLALVAGGLTAGLLTIASLLAPWLPELRGAVIDDEVLSQGGPLATGYWETIANGDRVNAFHRDGNLLWSATEGGGLVRWNMDDGTYTQYLYPQDGLLSNTVNDILAMPDGTLWLATERALTKFDPSSGAFTSKVPDFDTEGGMPARVVRALELRPDGKFYVGFGQEWDPLLQHPLAEEPGAFRDGGLALYDPLTDTWSREMHIELEDDKYTTITSENITDIAYGTDGLLWIGTEPHYVYQQDTNCGDEGVECVDTWVLAGGGLSGTDLDADGSGAFLADRPLENAEWVVYRPADSSGGSAKATACLSNSVVQLEPDVDGRMWVASVDRGLLLIKDGLDKFSCEGGLAYYTRATTGGSAETRVDGLRGRNVFSIDVDDLGRVWIAHGDGRDQGEGIAILEHNDTFHDSSASDQPWNSDDYWEFLIFDGEKAGATDAIITALDVEGSGERVFMGTKNLKLGDGYGLRRYEEAGSLWTPYATAENGLPSNQVTDVRENPETGEVWFATVNRGVARRAADGSWSTWRAFGRGDQVATVTEFTANGFSRFVTDISTREEYDLIFEGTSKFVRIGDDDTRYRVQKYHLAQGGLGPWLEVFPELQRDVPKDTPIYLQDRGPAGDHASQIAFGATRTYVGGRESVWLPRNQCANPPECWLDGGLGGFDGQGWIVWPQTAPGSQPDGSGVTDQEVSALATGLDGKIWVGTGNQSKSQGDGMSVYDPETDSFTYHFLPQIGLDGPDIGGNGIADFDVDPASGDVWVAHFPAKKLNESIDGTISEVFFGGGASRWDGTDWEFWRKGNAGSATMVAYGDGTFNAVAVDNGRDRVWLGGWNGLPRRFHWTEGRGVDATLNYCQLSDCRDEGWQAFVFAEEGEVTALDVDSRGRLWVGSGRRGFGFLPPSGATGDKPWGGPPTAGLRILDGEEWHAYAPSNTGLAGFEITSVDAAPEDGVWLGTREDGASHFLFTPPVPPTPTLTPTSSVARTATPTRTLEPTPTQQGGTPGTPAASATPGRTTPAPTATRSTPSAGLGCRPGQWPGWCYIYLPFSSSTAQWCARRPCIPGPAGPTPVRGVAPTATRVPPSATVPPSQVPPSATPTPPLATATNVPGQTPTATGTPAPQLTPSATATSGPSATVQPSPSPTATASATSESVPIGEWENINRTRSITGKNLRAVHGVAPDQVVLVGEDSTILIWDGINMTSGTAPPGRMLNDVHMLNNRDGYIAGDMNGQNGTFLRTRNGGQSWSQTVTSLVDDWVAVSIAEGADGPVGWVLGGGRGVRLLFEGTGWSTQGPADANNAAHDYSDVAVVSESLAFASQSGTGGARMYDWDGEGWGPGETTGGILAMDVHSATEGVAVGPSGSVWVLDPDGAWQRMEDRPRTAGRDLLAVSMVSPDLIWAVGERGGMWVWDGVEWRAETVSGVNVSLEGIWIAEDGRSGFAVGDNGTILQYSIP